MLKVIKYEKKNGIFYYTHSFYNNVILSHKFSLLSAVLMIANFFLICNHLTCYLIVNNKYKLFRFIINRISKLLPSLYFRTSKNIIRQYLPITVYHTLFDNN